MSAEILRLHEILAAGILEDRLADALNASAALFEDHRRFLRRLLGSD
jgi:hypothetical protein